jgi:hypothetical protein
VQAACGVIHAAAAAVVHTSHHSLNDCMARACLAVYVADSVVVGQSKAQRAAASCLVAPFVSAAAYCCYSFVDMCLLKSLQLPGYNCLGTTACFFTTKF